MNCPGCGGALGAVRVGSVQLRPCLACGGIWMGRTEFETLARVREARDVFLGSPHGEERGGSPPLSMEVRYRPCPACGKLMNRMNYARISGVILDSCREDGFWFDSDELRKVVLFIESGGLDRAREREETIVAATATALPGEYCGPPHVAEDSLSALVVEVLFDAGRALVRLVR